VTLTNPELSVVLYVAELKLITLPAEVTVILKVWDGEVSTPPLAVPPLSFRLIVIAALPLALVAGV
jgi:hypothetical protein